MRTARHRRARGSSAVLLWAVGTPPPPAPRRTDVQGAPLASARAVKGSEENLISSTYNPILSYPILSYPNPNPDPASPLSPPQTPCRALRG